GRPGPGVVVVVGDAPQVGAEQAGAPGAAVPARAQVGLGAGQGGGAEADVQHVLPRVARVLLAGVLVGPVVVGIEVEIAGTGGLQPVVGRHVDARGFLVGDVDRREVDAGDGAERVVRILADDARQGVHAGRRVDVDRQAGVGDAEAAVGLVDPQLFAALALDLVRDADPVVVHRQVEVGGRRPDEAGGERFAGFHVQ